MKSRLGQNFLTSKYVAQRIAEVADIQPNDVILEIGPGKGILTEAILAENPKKLIAVEKDKNFVGLLKEKFSADKNLEIVSDDALRGLEARSYKLEAGYKIVANIPYYITSYLLRLIFSQKNLPSKVVLMVQKEVAERLCARPPHMNLLALSVQVYGEPHIAFRVSKTFFKPRPKVDSAVIVIDNISRDFFKDMSEDGFFDLLHAGFRHKRKLLLSNLKSSISGIGKVVWKSGFKTCEINEKSRAENLSLKEWDCLFVDCLDGKK